MTTAAAAPSTTERGLRDLLDGWGLEDALQPEIDDVATPTATLAFHAKHHTYRYAIGGGGRGSSRLDKWYVTSAAREWDFGVSRVPPPPRADHDGVMLQWIDPANRTFTRRGQKFQ